MSSSYAVVTGSASGIGRASARRTAAPATGSRNTPWSGPCVSARLNLIVPGKTQTPIDQGAKDHPQMGRYVDRIPVPLGRIGIPEEMGAVIAFMLSDVASYIHGSIVWIDGGMHAALHPDAF